MLCRYALHANDCPSSSLPWSLLCYAMLCHAAASAHRYGSGKAAPPEARELEGCLGVLLLDFMRLYGRALNNIEVIYLAVGFAWLCAVLHGCWCMAACPGWGPCPAPHCSAQLLLCLPGPPIRLSHNAPQSASLCRVQVGISCRKGGSFFNKRNKGFFQASSIRRQRQRLGLGGGGGG